MGHLGVVLYEYLGEEYPEVLGSILGALKAGPDTPSTSHLNLSRLSFGGSVTETTQLYPTKSST